MSVNDSNSPGLGKISLMLFVTGRNPRSELAKEALNKICAKYGEQNFDVSVVDVLDNPQLAEREKILATPTLVKVLPLPQRRIVGDLTESQKVLRGLDLLPTEELNDL